MVIPIILIEKGPEQDEMILLAVLGVMMCVMVVVAVLAVATLVFAALPRND